MWAQIYATINTALRQSSSHTLLNPSTHEPFTDAERVGAAVNLMLLAGTDFSRPLPLLGPKRVWNSLPVVVNALLAGALRDGVVAALYKVSMAPLLWGSSVGLWRPTL